MLSAQHLLRQPVGCHVVVVEHRREPIFHPPTSVPAEDVGQLDGTRALLAGRVCVIAMALMLATVYAFWKTPKEYQQLTWALYVTMGFLLYIPQMLIASARADP